MNHKILNLSTLFILSIQLLGFSHFQSLPCTFAEERASGKNSSRAFQRYWQQGKAEITSYKLKQYRYRDQHPGHATMIYVTEDFSKSKQVKLDQPDKADADRAPILKLNFLRKFNTGIYPYSTMTSIFTPYDRKDQPYTLKVSTSSQEWCGHSFLQINHRSNGYHFLQRSYFESEADRSSKLANGWLEDELWTLLRINPKALPTGEINLLPATLFLQLDHLPVTYNKAHASLHKDKQARHRQIYHIKYPDIKRELKIHFSDNFPYTIEKWIELRQKNGKLQVTEAIADRRVLIDYWTRHGLQDRKLRQNLNLPSEFN